MAYQGGTWTTPDGILPGARINFVAKDRATPVLSPRGILALPIELDWGADDKVKIFKAKDYTRDALYNFGYEVKSKQLRNIDEAFKGATEIVLVRLNGNGDRAKCDIAEAKWPGIRGNDLEVSVEADPDAGVRENPAAGATVEFTNDGPQLIAKVNAVPDGYQLDADVVFDNEVVDVPVEVNGNKVIATLPIDAKDGDYTLNVYFQYYEVKTLIANAVYSVDSEPETQSKMVLSFITNTPGTSIPEELQNVKVTFKRADNELKVVYQNVPEGYTPASQLYLGTALVGWMNGRLEEHKDGNTITVWFGKDAGTAANYKYNARLKKDGTYTTIATQEFQVKKEGEDRDAFVLSEVTEEKTIDVPKQIPARYIVKTFLDGAEVERQKVRGVEMLRNSDFITWDKTIPLEPVAGLPLTGGTNSDVTMRSWSDALNKLEPQNFHILAVPCDDETVKEMCINFTREMRDGMGVLFQTVMPTTIEDPNYEAIIQVENEVLDKDADPRTSLIYWVAGQEAGCKVQNSIANMEYDGTYTIDLDYSQRSLEHLILQGRFFFHQARGIDRQQHCKTNVDINTLHDIPEGKDESWSRNQTIRTCDQIGNDIAALFNNNYFGKVPNTQSGREALKNDIIMYLSELETAGAIENFDPDSVVVEPGQSRVVVLVQCAVTPVNAMEQMYMTVYVI